MKFLSLSRKAWGDASSLPTHFQGLASESLPLLSMGILGSTPQSKWTTQPKVFYTSAGGLARAFTIRISAILSPSIAA